MKNILTPSKIAPGRPNLPFVLESLCGEVIYIPLSKSATRLLVTGKESDNAFAVVGSGGSQSDPIGFHFHRETHDVFLCLKGNINVWAGDQCRTMGVGDFASVPPGVVHQYQILGHHSEFVGLIVPGGWEEFFRFIGEPYDGPMFPIHDDRNVFEVLIPKLKAASEIFDMIPVRDHPQVEPQLWREDDALPGHLQPYFLRAGSAPRYALGGMFGSILAGVAESDGRFSIGSIEGSSWHKLRLLGIGFECVHHAFQVVDGTITFTLEAEQATLTAGETIYIPRGRRFSLGFVSRYAKTYVFTSGSGILDVIKEAGTLSKQGVLPEKVDEWDVSNVLELTEKLRFKIEA